MTSSKEREQIEAFQKLIKIYFNDKVEYYPKMESITRGVLTSADYESIMKAFDNRYTLADLEKLMGEITILAVNLENKLIFLYDTEYKFTEERKITLEHYPSDIKLGFPKRYWIQECKKIKAKHSAALPEALKDSMVDIEGYRSGYLVIRVSGKEFDWTKSGRLDLLAKLVENARVGKWKT